MLATATLQRLGTVVAGFVLVTTVAACGSSAPPSPSAPGGSPAAPSAPIASAQPSATGTSSGAPTNSGSSGGSGGSTTASPPAVEAAKAFLATMQRGDFQAEATITGEATVAATALDVSGSFTVRSADYHTVLKVATMTEETLTSNGVTYERRNGLWFVKPATTGGSTGSPLRSSDCWMSVTRGS
jgi:hypothetical protein